MAKRVTLFEPPPLDESKAPIENVLELTPVVDIGPVRLPPFTPPLDPLHRNHSLSILTQLGCLHQYPSTLASPRRPRHLWRSRHRPVPLGRNANGPDRFRRAQHALLLRSSR